MASSWGVWSDLKRMQADSRGPHMSKISADESARRQYAVDQARAANMRQGYIHDPVLEAANARYVQGDISLDELRREMRQAIADDVKRSKNRE
jgi:hypothetical protein